MSPVIGGGSLPRMSQVAMFMLAADIGGQAEYQSSLLEAVADLSNAITVTPVRTRSMRSDEAGDLRLPYTKLAALPGPLQRIATGIALRGHDLVHRCDLRLPSA